MLLRGYDHPRCHGGLPERLRVPREGAGRGAAPRPALPLRRGRPHGQELGARDQDVEVPAVAVRPGGHLVRRGSPRRQRDAEGVGRPLRVRPRDRQHEEAGEELLHAPDAGGRQPGLDEAPHGLPEPQGERAAQAGGKEIRDLLPQGADGEDHHAERAGAAAGAPHDRGADADKVPPVPPGEDLRPHVPARIPRGDAHAAGAVRRRHGRLLRIAHVQGRAAAHARHRQLPAAGQPRGRAEHQEGALLRGAGARQPAERLRLGESDDALLRRDGRGGREHEPRQGWLGSLREPRPDQLRGPPHRAHDGQGGEAPRAVPEHVRRSLVHDQRPPRLLGPEDPQHRGP
mmetsp:Transcript_2524/g.7090  ORF Transcript_2524/g.7090 Transcript_2524/m.7090 type:complete len:344 (-) Transcript_2524:4614-5645(-)